MQVTGYPDPRPDSALLTTWRYGIESWVVLPAMRYVRNSAIPYSVNDGFWAGRGSNVWLSGGGGVRVHRGPYAMTLVLAPTLYASQDLPFEVAQSRDTLRSRYASPWHRGLRDADLPLRMGDEPLRRATFGQSSVTLTIHHLDVAFTNADEWWGPAIRNTLILSNNAPGIPRLELGTNAPVRTRVGLFSARMFGGTLTESRFFDRDARNDYRSISGALVTYRPAVDTGLTIGFARTLVRPVSKPEHSPGRILDALALWPAAMPDSGRIVGPDSVAVTRSRRRGDQMASLFARWVIPASGLEVYVEWARMELPRTGMELLQTPHETQGYTMGAQWVLPLKAVRLRSQLEVTDLEQSAVHPARPISSFYTGYAAPAGFTQRGQVIGAAIGPGASSQWVATDYMAERWQAGLFASRIRWENDALYQNFPAPDFYQHDVSILYGLRGGGRLRLFDVSAELGRADRLNYLFQNGRFSPGQYGTVDVRNFTFSLSVTPR